MTPRVVVFGTAGYATTHLRRARAMHEAGELVLAGACDVRDPAPEARELLPPGAVFAAEAAELLRRTTPDIAVVATPPQTHLPLALIAVEAGCHLLVEKPPVLDLAGFGELAARAERAGVRVQVGFQSFGSRALPVLREAIGAGALGELIGIGTAGAWIRRDAYYARNPWAGRRRLNGMSVVDGALTNPFAHAIATALLLTGRADQLPAEIEVELHHARPIEADDTACARVLLPGGPPVVAAATLCAELESAPRVVLHGSRGKARWWYKTDLLALNGERVPLGTPVDLLRDLVRHVGEGTPLAAPLDQTRAFTAFVQAVRDAPEPKAIAAEWAEQLESGPERRYAVCGIGEAIESAAERLRLFSEQGVPWAG
ncbi:Gfo/Idh/MocA family protein [Crossiella sp. NPDC003009]